MLRVLALGAASRPASDIPQARASYPQGAARARPLVAQGKRPPVDVPGVAPLRCGSAGALPRLPNSSEKGRLFFLSSRRDIRCA